MDNKKQNIIHKATNIYKRFGIRKTNVEDIAKECQMATSALYYYFKNKDEITKEVFTNLLKERTQIMLDALEPLKEEPVTQIEKYIQINIDISFKAMQDFSINYYDIAEQYEILKSIQINDYKTQITIIKSILEKGIKYDHFSISDIHSMAISIYAVISGTIKTLYDFPENFEKEHLIKNLSTLLIKGLEKR